MNRIVKIIQKATISIFCKNRKKGLDKGRGNVVIY